VRDGGVEDRVDEVLLVAHGGGGGDAVLAHGSDLLG